MANKKKNKTTMDSEIGRDLENEHSRYVKRYSKMGESMQISDLWIFMTNFRGF